MADAPLYMSFHWDAFYGDADVQAMTHEAQGIYMRFMYVAWKESPPCTLPDDDFQLAAIAKVAQARWQKLKPIVMKPWELTPDGRWSQKRLRHEYVTAKKRIRAARKAGKASGRSRRGTPGNGQLRGDDETNDRSTTVQRQLNHQTRPEPIPNTKLLVNGSPQPPAIAFAGYVQSVARLPMPAVTATAELSRDFGSEVAVAVVEHLATRRPSSFATVKNWQGFLRKLFSEIEAGDTPEPGPRTPVRFEEWRANGGAA